MRGSESVAGPQHPKYGNDRCETGERKYECNAFKHRKLSRKICVDQSANGGKSKDEQVGTPWRGGVVAMQLYDNALDQIAGKEEAAATSATPCQTGEPAYFPISCCTQKASGGNGRDIGTLYLQYSLMASGATWARILTPSGTALVRMSNRRPILLAMCSKHCSLKSTLFDRSCLLQR